MFHGSNKQHWRLCRVCVFTSLMYWCVSTSYKFYVNICPLTYSTYGGLRVNFSLEFQFKGLLSRAGVLCSSLSHRDDLQCGEKRHEIKHLPHDGDPCGPSPLRKRTLLFSCVLESVCVFSMLARGEPPQPARQAEQPCVKRAVFAPDWSGFATGPL